MARSRTKAGDLKEACVREALVVIGEVGIEKLSLRDLARRLGVSHQAPYKHFPSREHLIAAIVSHAYQDFAVYLENRPKTGDPHEDLKAMGIAYLCYARERPLHYELMFATNLPDADQHPEMVKDAQHAFNMLRDGIAALNTTMDKPHFPPTEMDAMFVWSTLHGLAQITRTTAMETLKLPAEMLENLMPFALQGIGHALANSGTEE
jgi:AcrR family transcriptional regulator